MQHVTSILFVSHDANMGGAQLVLINIIGWIKDHTDIKINILCLNNGNRLTQFQNIGDTRIYNEKLDLLSIYSEIDLIYGNTSAAGQKYSVLSILNKPIITHFHELEMSIKKYASDYIKDTVSYSDHFIGCSIPVSKNLIENYAVNSKDITTVHASIIPNRKDILDNEEKVKLKKDLGVHLDKFIIIGCGIGMAYRKGADLFINVAEILLNKGYKNFHFYWIGEFSTTEKVENRLWKYIIADMNDELRNNVTFLGFKKNAREYISIGDVMLLTSREDPFPLVALEASEAGVPVICFEEAGGMPYFVKDCGYVVPYLDIQTMAVKVITLLENPNLSSYLGIKARDKFLNDFTIDKTTPFILNTIRNVSGKNPYVSIILPNYNHQKYLKERLDSIINQSFQDFEVIIIDDASTDDSLSIIRQYIKYPNINIIYNETNSGSPFKQWLKGLSLAKGEIIWIAESDDVADLKFLSSLLPAFEDNDVNLAYSNSHVIDKDSNIIGDYSSSSYLCSLSETKWKNNYIQSAEKEINDGLGVKNTILNVSSVLFRKFILPFELEENMQNMRIAGDWLFEVVAIKEAKIYYDCRKLNYHRRHVSSVIGQMLDEKRIKKFFDEFYLVQKYIFENYNLDENFAKKWLAYLESQYRDFIPEASFESISEYYPLDFMKSILDNK